MAAHCHHSQLEKTLGRGEISEAFAAADHHEFLGPLEVLSGVGKWEKVAEENRFCRAL